jgi:hypothetical protein
MTAPSTKPSVAFWIISVLALIWNLMGVMQLITQVTMTPETLAALPANEQAMYTDCPTWALVAFGVAVFGSALGCILLLLRKKIAGSVFTIAYIGILVQMIYSLFFSRAIEIYGPGGAVMPIMIILIGGFLIWYSRRAAAMGWLR